MTARPSFLTKSGAHGNGPGELFWPGGLAVDAAGAVLVADEGNFRAVRCCPSVADPAGSSGSGGPQAPSTSGAPASDRTAARIDAAGKRGLSLRLNARARRALRRIGTRKPRIFGRAVAVDGAGNHSSASFVVTLKR